MRRDLVAVVEVARDRRVDPDRTCCRVDDAAVHDKLVGFVHAAWSCPVGCDVECPPGLKRGFGDMAPISHETHRAPPYFKGALSRNGAAERAQRR